MLAPTAATAHKDIGRPSVAGTVVAAIAIDRGGVAGLHARPDDDGVAGDRHALAEVVTSPAVVGFEIGLLAKGRVNGQGVTGLGVVHQHLHLAAVSHQVGGQGSAGGIPHLEVVIGQDDLAGGVVQGKLLAVTAHLRRQCPVHLHGEA